MYRKSLFLSTHTDELIKFHDHHRILINFSRQHPRKKKTPTQVYTIVWKKNTTTPASSFSICSLNYKNLLILILKIHNPADLKKSSIFFVENPFSF